MSETRHLGPDCHVVYKKEERKLLYYYCFEHNVMSVFKASDTHPIREYKTLSMNSTELHKQGFELFHSPAMELDV